MDEWELFAMDGWDVIDGWKNGWMDMKDMMDEGGRTGG